jgi:hypothetical protein
MATTRLTEKISQLVSGQLPEFLRNDYPLFVSLIEAYYRYLEQDQQALELVQNALSYNDIDRTAGSFVQYFLKNYATNIPLTAQLNKKFLVKRINDLYEAKGSELSFKLLFKLLYDVSVEQSRPYDFVLRPSDGIWDQRVSLRIERTGGSVSDLTDRFIFLTKNGIEYRDAIIRVKNLTTNLYEVFLKSTTSTPYEVDDVVVVKDENGDVVFTGEIRPTAVSYSISQPGTGFRAGQVFTISFEGAVDTVIRILEVDSNGGIVLLKILNYGYGFTGTSLSIDLYNDLTVASRTKTFITKSEGFKDTIILTLPHTPSTGARYFFSDYVASGDYTGSLLATNIDDATVAPFDSTGESDAAAAVISFTYGAIARYPGQYLSSKGFLSEPVVRLQDGGLYQPFAYQLKNELDITYFYDTVLKLVHPAGTKLYNDRVIETFANVRANVNVLTRSNVFLELEENLKITDEIIFGYYVTPALETATINDNLAYSLSKPVDDTANISDSTTISITKSVTADTVSPTDSLTLSINLVLSDTANVLDSVSTVTSYLRTLTSSITPDDANITFNISKLLSNSLTLTDTTVAALALSPISDSTTSSDTTSLRTNKIITDDVTPGDSLVKTVYTNINNNVSTVSLTETANARITSYAVPGYFSELYAGSVVTLI